MRNEEDKAKIEIKVFEEFTRSAGLSVKEGSIRKGDPNIGEPDICCEIDEKTCYFELAEACAPEIAAAITRSIKTEEPEYIRAKDASRETIKKKLQKTYEVVSSVELVLYIADKTVLPDDVIAEKIEPSLFRGLGPFSKIWLFSNKATLLASNS